MPRLSWWSSPLYKDGIEAKYLDPRSSSRAYKQKEELLKQAALDRAASETPHDSEAPELGIYRALSLEAPEIRLCILLPSPDDATEIQCRLEHVYLGKSRPYEALSYVWGNADLSETIRLDGRAFSVTANLHSALQHLRYPDQERVLWIDALCIHQSDLGERKSQVRHMRDIYAHCRRDILWFGAEDDVRGQAVVSAMRIMEKLSSRKLDDIISLGWECIEGEEVEPKSISNQAAIFPTTRDWSDLRSFLHAHVIWTRMWIVQEISLSPEILMVCGRHTLNWKHLEDFLDTDEHFTDAFHSPYSHSADTLSAVFEKVQVLRTQRAMVRRMTEEAAETVLLDVLARFRFTLATDDRDKIFGLLGLISDHCTIAADYTKSVEQVFIDTTFLLIENSRNLDLICQSPWLSFGNEARHPQLPSWCPDFAVPGDTVFLFAQRSIFSAGSPECAVPCRPSASGSIKLSGYIIGSISSLPEKSASDPSKRLDDETGVETPHPNEYFGWLSSYQHLQQDPTGEDLFRAFYRTLVADCIAYPTARLTSEQIDHDVDVFRKYCRETSADADHPVDRNGGGPQMKKRRLPPELPANLMLDRMTQHWRFALTRDELFAMVPQGSEVDDIVVVLDGAKVPLTLRKISADATRSDSADKIDEEEVVYRVIGGTYLHGFMDGEVYSQETLFEKQELQIR